MEVALLSGERHISGIRQSLGGVAALPFPHSMTLGKVLHLPVTSFFICKTWTVVPISQSLCEESGSTPGIVGTSWHMLSAG
jgi:hypothetical protein